MVEWSERDISASAVYHRRHFQFVSLCIHLSIVAIFAQIYKSVDNHACQSNILNHTEEFAPNFDVIIASCGSVLDILKANC